MVIQRACKEKLNLPSQKMAKKYLLTQRMKARGWHLPWNTGSGGLRRGRKLCFLDEIHFKLHFSEKFSQCKKTWGQIDWSPNSHRRLSSNPWRSWLGGASAGRAGGL
jgi:hypothetical protein